MGTGWRGAVGSVLAASADGVSDEWHQSVVPGRSVEVADWLADTLGAAVAVGLYAGVPAYRRLLEMPLGRKPVPPEVVVKAPEAPSRAQVWSVVAVLFLGTVLLFARATANGFVNYDDPDYVTANEHVKAGVTAAGLKWAFFSGDISYWHPLTWVSHM
eukprot:gene49365-67042_t